MRRALAEAYTTACFGGTIMPATPTDRWLVLALARMLVHKYMATTFGHTRAKFELFKDSQEACDLQLCTRFPCLSSKEASMSSDPQLLDFCAKRGHMVLRLVEARRSPAPADFELAPRATDGGNKDGAAHH